MLVLAVCPTDHCSYDVPQLASLSTIHLPLPPHLHPATDKRDFLQTLPLPLNDDQSNPAKGGIAVPSPPNSSFAFTRTDNSAAICNCTFWLAVRPPFSPSPECSPTPIQHCVIGPHKCTCQMASKSVQQFKQGAQM